MGKTNSVLEQWVSRILLGLILVFSVTSIGNISEFVGLYHRGWTGTTLGVAIGVVTFTTSYISAKTTRLATRVGSIIIALIFGLCSGWFQMEIYTAGGAPFWIAGALSFVPIIVGEVGLAFLEYLYSSDQSSDGIAQLNTEQLIADRLNALIAEQFNVFSDRLNEVISDRLNTEHQALNTIIEQLNSVQLKRGYRTLNTEHPGLNTDQCSVNHDSVNTDRARLNTDQSSVNSVQSERLDKIIELYAVNPAASIRSVARDLGVSPATISSDLKSLENTGRIHKNGVVTVL